MLVGLITRRKYWEVCSGFPSPLLRRFYLVSNNASFCFGFSISEGVLCGINAGEKVALFELTQVVAT